VENPSDRRKKTAYSLGGVSLFSFDFDRERPIPEEKIKSVYEALRNDSEVREALESLAPAEIELYLGYKDESCRSFCGEELAILRLNANLPSSDLKHALLRFQAEKNLEQTLKLGRFHLSYSVSEEDYGEECEEVQHQRAREFLTFAKAHSEKLQRLRTLRCRSILLRTHSKTRPEHLWKFEKTLEGFPGVFEKMKTYAERGFSFNRNSVMLEEGLSVYSSGGIVDIDIEASGLTLEKDFLKFESWERELRDKENEWEELRKSAPQTTLTVSVRGEEALLAPFETAVNEMLASRFSRSEPDRPLLNRLPAPTGKVSYGRDLPATDYQLMGTIFILVQQSWMDVTDALARSSFKNPSEDCSQLTPELYEELRNRDLTVPLVLELEVGTPFPFRMEIRSFHDTVQFRMDFEDYKDSLFEKLGYEP
jgi:hypothetical protein